LSCFPGFLRLLTTKLLAGGDTTRVVVCKYLTQASKARATRLLGTMRLSVRGKYSLCVCWYFSLSAFIFFERCLRALRSPA
jgi:hypothetical protein